MNITQDTGDIEISNIPNRLTPHPQLFPYFFSSKVTVNCQWIPFWLPWYTFYVTFLMHGVHFLSWVPLNTNMNLSCGWWGFVEENRVRVRWEHHSVDVMSWSFISSGFHSRSLVRWTYTTQVLNLCSIGRRIWNVWTPSLIVRGMMYPQPSM